MYQLPEVFSRTKRTPVKYLGHRAKRRSGSIPWFYTVYDPPFSINYTYLHYLTTSSPADKISGQLWRRIKNRRRQIRWYDLNNNESTTLLTFTIWKHDYVKKWSVSEQSAIQKRLLFEKSQFFFIKRFLHTFCQKRTSCYPTTFIESLITHKWFVFEESYILYGKRQKSCTLIVI